MSVDDGRGAGNASVVPIDGGPPGTRCWRAALDIDPARLPAHEAVLSEDELRRAARFGTPALRARYVTGRAILRSVLAEVLGVAARGVPIVRGGRGRPCLAGEAGIDFNVSHTRGLAVIAVSVRDRIGVDVEHEDRRVDADRLARRVMSAREREHLLAIGDAGVRRGRFLRAWTCKEAMSKATGDGIAAPFRRIEVDIDAPRVVDGPAPYAPGDWTLFALRPGNGYLATLAVWRGATRQVAE